ncbi:MAG TPA: glycosyltransferase family 9 protein [Caulobacteraceae bacterium]|nr:glycosyltransferase family 9 protein [Caulobacteraceae bacterium]
MLVDREGLGDVILKAPFLRALRQAFPAHAVWWIATHQSSMADDLRPLFAADVAQVITHAALDGAPGPLLKRLKALGRFDLVFDSRTKLSTVALARFGLEHRRFYCCLPGHLLSDGDARAAGPRPRHIAGRMLSMLSSATGRPPPAPSWLTPSTEAAAEAQALLPDGPTYVGIAPGSRQPNKNWPLDRFAACAAALAARAVTPVFLLGPQELDVQATIAAAAPTALIVKALAEVRRPGHSLDTLIARGRRLAVLLANDNGVGHLVGASGVPVVSLFGPTDPRRWAPVAPANMILEARQFGASRDIANIPADAVVKAVMGVIERQGE